MPPKKQKAQKMALADFFAETPTGGSWADEMEAMPTAPAARDPSAPRRGDPGYFESLPERGSRQPSFPGNGPPREELPLPTSPPYTAFVGNLTFETDEAELTDFFVDLKPVNVKIIKDSTGKAKGFGYVEFPTLEALKTGLSRTGAQLGGRTIRVSVAEAPANRRDASAAEESSQWRRSGPLPTRNVEPLPGRRVPSFAGSERDGARDAGPERDWGAARGAKFQPSPNASTASPPIGGGGFRRETSGPGFVREKDLGGPAGQADEASAWRSSKPLVDVRGNGAGAGAGRDVPPHQRGASGVGAGSGPISPSLADTEQTWTRGSKLRTPAPEPPVRSATNSPAEPERDWRGSRAASAVPSAGSRQGSVSGESSPATSAPAPSVRQKLQLAPRSTSTSDPSSTSETGSPTPSATPSSKASPFGAARPIDTSAREQEAATKLASREEERKKAREAEQSKVKEEAERRLAAATAAASGASTHAGHGREPHRRVHPSRKGSGPGSPLASPTNGHGHGHGNGTHNGFGAKSKSDNVVPSKEDGFEGTVVKGPKGSGTVTTGGEKEKKKESTVRPTFSFAAAAGKLGLVEGEGEEGVEEITENIGKIEVS